jgi:ABC-type phosphate transport system substrate-binding protein
MVRLPVRPLLTLAAAAALHAAGVGPTAEAGPGPGPAPFVAGPQAAERLAVVVNDDVPGDSLDAATVRRVFLRRQRFWGDGELVAPVNLPATSALRERFSLAILGRSPRDMADFWNDLYFNGVQPPPVLESQRAVLLYVARTPGAIGYVAADSVAPPGRRDGYRVALVVTR